MTTHGKNPPHLQVTVAPETRTNQVTATWCPPMEFEQHIVSWSIVLSKHHGQPLQGMHLLPDAVTWLPAQLRAHADQASGTQTVIVSHTFSKVFVHFCALDPADAYALASAIDHAAALHP